MEYNFVCSVLVFVAFSYIDDWQFQVWSMLSFLNTVRQNESIEPLTADDFEKINKELFLARNRTNDYGTRCISNHLLNSAFKVTQELTRTLRVSGPYTVPHQYEFD